MATGDRVANIFLDCLLSKTTIKERILGYLTKKVDEVLSALLQSKTGTLSADKIGLVSDGADNVFKLDLTNANRVVVGSGQVISLANKDENYHTKLLQFENDTSVIKTYYVAMPYAQVPQDPDVDPRKGLPRYLSLEDTFGEVGHPDSVAIEGDPATGIRLELGSLTDETSYAGRQCRVWLDTPLSAVESVCFVEATIQFDTVNYVVLPYSGGTPPLGLSAPPSEVETDYSVWVYGPKVTVDAGIASDPDYAFLGTITTDDTPGPPTFDVSNQLPVFLISLDAAYDGVGAGGGRVMFVDNGPIEKRSYPSAAYDPINQEIDKVLNPFGHTLYKMNAYGFRNYAPYFHDDFLYDHEQWDTNYEYKIPHPYRITDPGDNSVATMLNPTNSLDNANPHYGLLGLRADEAQNVTPIKLIGPAFYGGNGHRLGMRVQFGAWDWTKITAYALWRNPAGNSYFGFKVFSGTLVQVYKAAAGVEQTSGLWPLSANTMYTVYLQVTGASELSLVCPEHTDVPNVETMTGIDLDALVAANVAQFYPELSAVNVAVGTPGTLNAWAVDAWTLWASGVNRL